MEKKRYKLFVVCIRDGCNGKEGFIKKGIHAEKNFSNDKEALEKFWQIAHKDLDRLFDRVSCSVLKRGVRIGIFNFPEKRA